MDWATTLKAVPYRSKQETCSSSCERKGQSFGSGFCSFFSTHPVHF